MTRPAWNLNGVPSKRSVEFHTDRINVSIPPEKKEALRKNRSAGLGAVDDAKGEKFITTDGYKFLLPDTEWVAFRASGTEPLVRCYIEAKSAKQMKRLQESCRAILTG